MSIVVTTLCAFDYGHKRIGVAISNTLTRFTQALTTIENRNRKYRFAAVGELINQWQPTQLVVGLPVHLDDTPHWMTQQALRFGNQLNGRFNLPVTWVDERYSSVEAKAAGARGVAVDARAACIILQQYFDERGYPRGDNEYCYRIN
ncbi:Holliday junction resolvase RuvX [Candidatus Vallotia cooleyia]|uniref:Holliday junction resolvase RuvX n=1 Tax=Candidatus Vallotiella adelgis TaxID=1177211 RepID=UPI001D02FF61|nr:Holliday junction resolvase RuvX [Candidatus Vallotia cooleyia]UDG82450.1 Putative pre-16S rRNA nuclease [Candidatus Vallotia cooleyia]